LISANKKENWLAFRSWNIWTSGYRSELWSVCRRTLFQT